MAMVPPKFMLPRIPLFAWRKLCRWSVADSFLDELAFQAGSGVYHLVNSTSPIAELLCFFAFDFIIVTKSSVVGKKTRKQHNIYEKALS